MRIAGMKNSLCIVPRRLQVCSGACLPVVLSCGLRRLGLLALCAVLCGAVVAQGVDIHLTRYVSPSGAYDNDGLSWATARNNLQDAINDLHSYMQDKGISEGGRIFVQGGDAYPASGDPAPIYYAPSESTEKSSGGALFTAFKIYGGITLYGGFAGTESDPGERLLADGQTIASGQSTKKPWELKYSSILTGDHTATHTATTFEWNAKSETWTPSFPGNSYHVVWFATNGLSESNRGLALSAEAVLDGFIVEGGSSSNKSMDEKREHTAFGGGIYMVEGAVVRNCEVRKNTSSRRGGGIYLDGGGIVDSCYVHTNQTLGIGIIAGYGGGVCVDDGGSVYRSLITGNVARIGGGLALTYEKDESRSCYNPAAAGCVVSNNTSTTEAGGVFLYKGGQLNHMTITRNKCTGPNVVVGGRRYGRTAGLYIDRTGIVTNSVLWGGEVAANNNVQYAAYTLDSNSALGYIPYVSYSAVSGHDLADWSNTSKREIISLGDQNSGSGGLYPNFEPGTDGVSPDDLPAGVDTSASHAPESHWMPAGFSPLREAGVQLLDFLNEDFNLNAHIAEDMNGSVYAPLTTLGAYVPARTDFMPCLLAPVEPGTGADKVLTFFVDPERSAMNLIAATSLGHSWDEPLEAVGDALSWIEQHRGKEITYYVDPASNATASMTLADDALCQVLVKEGTGTTSGTYFSTRLRTSYIQLTSRVHLIGSYPKALTGTALGQRDPKNHPTVLSADVIGNGYAFNTCHILGYGGASHTIVDGFTLSYAYSLPNEELNAKVDPSSPLRFTPILQDGGAIVAQNAIGSYGSMTDNVVRNCVFSNCTSRQGSAVYAQSTKADVDIEIAFENCIFHNNTATAASEPATIYAESLSGQGGTVSLTFDHCDIVKNVGWGLCVNGAGASVDIRNSIVWANAAQAYSQSASLGSAPSDVRCLQQLDGGTFTGSRCFFDAGAGAPSSLGQNILTYQRDEVQYTYPLFTNPTRNIGASAEGDQTYYGGSPDFTPRTMNPIVNAADPASKTGYDLTLTTLRNYGGAADCGAIENRDLPQEGKVIYVRDLGDTATPGGDGSSWAEAINGNYTGKTADHGFFGWDAEPYADGKELTGLQWAVDEAYYRSLQKTGSDIDVLSTSGIEVNGVADQTVTRGSVVDAARVQVWVAQGEYLRREGFFMRDGVDVYGGFPDAGSPGMNERDPKKYETIIETNTNEEIENDSFEWGVCSLLPGYETAYPGRNSLYAQSSMKIPRDLGFDVVSTEQDGHGTNMNAAEYVLDGDQDTNNNNVWHSSWSGTKATPPHYIIIGMLDDGKDGTSLDDYVERVIGMVRIWCHQSRCDKIKILGTNTPTDDNSWTLLYPYDGVATAVADDGETYASVSTASNPLVISLAAEQRKSFKFVKFIFYGEFARINEIEIGDGTDDFSQSYSYDINKNLSDAYHTQRVLTQPFAYLDYSSTSYTFIGKACDMEYMNIDKVGFGFETAWDGFAIRNGRTRINHTKDGGAGAALRHNGVLRNCVISNNNNKGTRLRGGGIFNNGGSLENCEVSGNTLTGNGAADAMGGGMYIRTGKGYSETAPAKCFNTIFVGNECVNSQNYGSITVDDVVYPNTRYDGAAVYFEDGEFFNNTITKNKGHFAMATAAWFDGAIVDVYNSIIYENDLDGDIEIYFKGGDAFDLTVDHCLLKYSENDDGTQKLRILTLGGGSKSGLNYYEASSPFVDEANGDYTLAPGSKAINSGTEIMFAEWTDEDGDGIKETWNPLKDAGGSIRALDLPEYDAAYAARIQDCAVDIGAYEYNGAYAISPTVNAEGTEAVYFVTQNGAGTASAHDVDNAACMQKLQKVLDAAGRYKYLNPAKKVIVKVARIVDGGYLPSRTSVADIHDMEAENPRTYSIIVPRGVEVWGGYTEDFATRDVLAYKTILNGRDYSVDGQLATAYHVVTFTEDLFDEEESLISAENPWTSADGLVTVTGTLADKAEEMGTNDRAILDGLFIEGGDASGTVVNSTNSEDEQNYSRFGGAAVVTAFAHVRNCILYDNEAVEGGGALFLLPGSLVSGCLLYDNVAARGGALYARQHSGPVLDITLWSNIRDFAHIYSCTVVQNTATDAGGGVWFNNNLRVNSSVFWDNDANNSKNVCGQTDPFSTAADLTTSLYYPFSYSAVENIRVPGLNNVSVATISEKGVRFAEAADDPYSPYYNSAEKDIPVYYYLQRYSVLARAGEDVPTYNLVRTSAPADETVEQFYFPTLEAADLVGNSRVTYNLDKDGNVLGDPVLKDFIEIGARAYNGPLVVEPTAASLLKRLFVVQAEDVDESDYAVVAANGNYEVGSSFAFPFQQLDDALMYVQNARKTVEAARDMTFEIFVARGTFYPYRNVAGTYAYSRGNTFLVPEGVHVFGGLDPAKRYGQDDDETSTDISATVGSEEKTIRLENQTTAEILSARELADLNNNSIKEPWEFEYQTILSGQAVNSETANDVYHVLTCIADESAVGTLPTGTAGTPSIEYDANGTTKLKYEAPETRGVAIVLDGLQIVDGKAVGYKSDAVTNAYSYYKGGGVLVDGNWGNYGWKQDGTIDEGHEMARVVANRHSVGRRDIPLVVRNCEFSNNRAGAGGAIYSNGSLEIFSCNFVQNAAKHRSETMDDGTPVECFGNGGAVYCTYSLGAINTMFANNEAGFKDEPDDVPTLSVYGSRGGAIYFGANEKYGHMNLLNCDVVRNQAPSYPAIFCLYPNRGGTTPAENPHKIVNTIFWGNEISDNTATPLESNSALDPDDAAEVHNYVVNYWHRSNGAFVKSMADFASETKAADGYPDIGEMLWFCAYEEDRGRKPRNYVESDPESAFYGLDYRAVRYRDADDKFGSYIPDIFNNGSYWKNEAGATTSTAFTDNEGGRWNNLNVYLDKSNGALNGPNFVNPSLKAGADSYLPSADWMMSRQNNLTDAGWTLVRQTITKVSDDKYECEFDTPISTNTQGYYGELSAVASSNTLMDLPLGNEIYMEWAETRAGQEPIYRVSKDPNPSQHQTYIDIGVYEYQHVTLHPTEIGNETDVLWVSTAEKPENGEADGSSWDRPTSDLQRAIETLLASRNNHHKRINIIEGTYAPIYTIDGRLCFTINTGSLNYAVTFPAAKDIPAGITAAELGIRSLTFQGGFGADVKGTFGVEDYPVLFQTASGSGVNDEKTTSIFRIPDARNWFNEGADASLVAGKAPGDVTSSQLGSQRVIPLTFAGISMRNELGNVAQNVADPASNLGEGAAIAYLPQYQAYADGTEWKTTSELCLMPDSLILAGSSAEATENSRVLVNKPKLDIHQCTFLLNGSDVSVPAVTIGSGGGYALVYNSLFHSNAGRSLSGFDTRVVNCTFALNGGNVWLRYDDLISKYGKSDDDELLTAELRNKIQLHSMIHNSILWRNGANNQDADESVSDEEYDLPKTDGAYCSNNTIYGTLGGNFKDLEWNGYVAVKDVEASNTPGSTKYIPGGYNTWLAGDNYDLLNGPHFVDPKTEATLPEEKALRDFHLAPSARTINPPYLNVDQTYLERVYNGATTWGTIGATETDLAGRTRRINDIVDKGAYEYQGTLERVLYVDPNRTGNENDGTGWETPYCKGQLQTAVDLAAVYGAVNSQTSYVFCKGSAAPTGEGLTLRPWVRVFGSIPAGYTRQAARNGDNSNGYHLDSDLADYVTRVVGDRPGLAAFGTQGTVVTGVRTYGSYAAAPALVDGFVVSASDTEGALADIASPIVDLGNGTDVYDVALRNAIVRDNRNTSTDDLADASAGIARVRGGLLYNVLFRDNALSADHAAVLYVGAKGHAVNCTAVAEGDTHYAIGLTDDTPAANALVNVLSYNDDRVEASKVGRKKYFGGSSEFSADGSLNCNVASEGYPFARYFNPAAGDAHPGAPAYVQANHNLRYQLEEHSPQLNRSTPADFLSGLATDVPNYEVFIDYDADRDLLGNPRKMNWGAAAAPVDRGCYETWLVEAGQKADATYRYTAASPINGGKRFPQPGSVVYLLEGADLVLDKDDFDPSAATSVGHEGRTETIRPGYLLLGEGASLYGQGAALLLPYVSVERTIGQAGAMVSLPYDFDYGTAVTRTYDASGRFQALAHPLTDSIYVYDGLLRAAHDYVYQAKDAPTWKPVGTAGLQPAGSAFYVSDALEEDYVFRFTGVATASTAPLYREGYVGGTIEKAKTVVLTQYDHRDVGTENFPAFTSAENMGWNLVGVPYLVSRFPAGLETAADPYNPEAYGVSLPRIVYAYKSADGTFPTAQSWQGGFDEVPVGAAYFVQTAVKDHLDTETLTFRQPMYPTGSSGAEQRVLRLADEAGRADVMAVLPEAEAEADIAYTLGRDGLKWLGFLPEAPQVYAVGSGGTRFALMGSAPVGTEIPVGIRALRGGQFTFSLPVPEAYADFAHVWLTDRATGSVTDLLVADYAVALADSTQTDTRFTLKFGGMRPVADPLSGEAGVAYRVYIRGGILYVLDLQGGESLRVYDAGGRRLADTAAPAGEYRLPVAPGIYVVKVGGSVYKVR